MIVENVTKVQGNIVVKDLEKAHMRNQTTTFILQGIVLLCGAVMVGIGVSSKTTPNVAFGTVFIILGLIYIFYTISRIKRERKEIKVVNRTVYENGCIYNYKFKQESIFCDFTAGDKHQKFECKYDEVKKVYEHPTKYEIVLYDHTILYANKDGFKGEKADEFFRKNLAFNKKKIKVVKD